jgi:transcriptional regulator with PAS, ATPase and Fis domain
LAALSLGDKPSLDNLEAMTFDSRQKFSPGFFTLNKFKPLFSALLKLKYKDTAVDWTVTSNISRILNTEIIRGAQYLMQEGVLDTWLMSSSAANFKTDTNIPELDLVIGKYEDDLEAKLDVNSRSISNTQILIAGTTGSGKSNLLAVLMHQLRSLSADTLYPVNFLFFDYKGEFSDPANAHWLNFFETDQGAILRPIDKPLPFTPFKDFSKNQNINELNLYSTSISKALCSIDQAKISANMNERLSSAIIYAYKQTGFKPVTFQKILDNYTSKLSDRDQKNGDSVTSVLSFKSPHFDFYANAQYPLIMKQQSISDGIIKDLFGVSGKDFQELKENISSLQKGELILRDDTAALLGIGKKWKKIKVDRLI